VFAPDLVVSEPRNRKSFTQSFLGELCLSAAMRIEINPGLKSTVAKHLLRDGVLSEIEQAISALPADSSLRERFVATCNDTLHRLEPLALLHVEAPKILRAKN